MMPTLPRIGAGLFSVAATFLLMSNAQITDWIDLTNDPGVSLSIWLLNCRGNLDTAYQPGLSQRESLGCRHRSF